MEAMKMETQVLAARAGRVRLRAKQGDYLQAGDMLAQGLEIGGDQDVVEAAGQLAGPAGLANEGLGQAVVEGRAHLQVGVAQAVLPARADLA